MIKRSKEFIHSTKYLLMRFAVFGLILISWELLANTGVMNPFYTSQPSRIFADLIQFYNSGDLVKHTSVTLKEALWGLAIGTVIGIIAGFILGLVDILGKVFEPIITALYGIPKLALAPIFVLWFGLGIESKIIMASLLVFFLVFFSTYAGIKSVDRNLLTSVKLMGASRFQLIIKVILPSCVPWILAGVRGGLGASLIGAIVGEYMGASAGLGWMISYATSFFQVDRVMACIFILFFIGIIFNMLLKNIEKVLLKWRPPIDYGGSGSI
ncbi:ABC transporter permease [Desulfuribacillus alkaliarsenatis]|uniref:ABC transporter permease n=1 Tax=Desulfuribacillus alkaliarsenatis TaxID=766136 RepID=A0A1E5G2V3_9FIRM|nr:ABC transporter permease [Desulfuribacillus alkaliarsenatis]OEF97415.1 ABC transporter permease [Desulfuribacillus alkaliarsenatis]